MLRALGLGDVLAGVPALRALRLGLPSHRLVLAAPTAYADLLRPDNLLDACRDTSGLDAPGWIDPVDVAVNLHGCGPQSHRLLATTAPARWVAFGCSELDVPGPQWRADEPERDRWCRLVRATLDVRTDPDDVVLTPPPQPAPVGDVVVVHPGAAHHSRRWPAEHFGRLVRILRDDGHPVVVTGSAAERPLAAEVAGHAELPAEAVLAGRTPTGVLAAVVAAARLVICGDTGVAHLASAYRTPSVVLFGPTSPRLWGPPLDGPHTVLWHGGPTGDPWSDELDPALAKITVPEVVTAARARLSTLDCGRVAGRAASGDTGGAGDRRPERE